MVIIYSTFIYQSLMQQLRPPHFSCDLCKSKVVCSRCDTWLCPVGDFVCIAVIYLPSSCLWVQCQSMKAQVGPLTPSCAQPLDCSGIGELSCTAPEQYIGVPVLVHWASVVLTDSYVCLQCTHVCLQCMHPFVELQCPNDMKKGSKVLKEFVLFHSSIKGVLINVVILIQNYVSRSQAKLKPLGVTSLLPKTGFNQQLLKCYLETPPSGNFKCIYTLHQKLEGNVCLFQKNPLPVHPWQLFT